MFTPDAQKKFIQAFSPHAERYSLVLSTTTDDKQGLLIEAAPTAVEWQKHFTNDNIRLALAPSHTQGYVQWAVLDVDDQAFNHDIPDVGGIRYPSNSGKLHILYRFGKDEKINEVIALLSRYATMLGTTRFDVFPSSNGTTTISLPKFHTTADMGRFLQQCESSRTVAEHWSGMVSGCSKTPLCFWKVSRDGIPAGQTDEALRSGFSHLYSATPDSSKPLARDMVASHHRDLVGKLERLAGNTKLTKAKISKACLHVMELGLCAGEACALHPKHIEPYEVQTSATPFVESILLTSDIIDHVVKRLDCDDPTATTYSIYTTESPIPINIDHNDLNSRTMFHKSFSAVLRSVELDKEEFPRLTKYIMSVAVEHTISFEFTLTGRVMSTILEMQDSLPLHCIATVATPASTALVLTTGEAAFTRGTLANEILNGMKGAKVKNGMIEQAVDELVKLGKLNKIQVFNKTFYAVRGMTLEEVCNYETPVHNT